MNAVTPGAPTDPKAHVIMQRIDTGLNDSMIHLKWNKPLNADHFDLRYYHVQATIPQQIRSFYTWNVTGTELVTRMEMPKISKDMRISVAAVSMCSELQGQEVFFNKKGGETATVCISMLICACCESVHLIIIILALYTCAVAVLDRLVDIPDNLLPNRNPASINISPQISNGESESVCWHI